MNYEFFDYFNNKDFSQLKCPYVLIPASEANLFDSTP